MERIIWKGGRAAQGKGLLNLGPVRGLVGSNPTPSERNMDEVKYLKKENKQLKEEIEKLKEEILKKK